LKNGLKQSMQLNSLGWEVNGNEGLYFPFFNSCNYFSSGNNGLVNYAIPFCQF
jgi:hypothetical protein